MAARLGFVLGLTAGGISIGILVAVLFLSERTVSQARHTIVVGAGSSRPPDGRDNLAPTQPIIWSVPSADLVTSAFNAKMDWTVSSTARVLILPHHTVAAREIASLVSAVPRPSVVYLVSPDHFSQGKTVFTTTLRSFTTSMGKVDTDGQAVQEVVAMVPGVTVNDQALEREHGVGALLPFFAKAWPDTRVVPIMVRLDATSDDRRELAETLVGAMQTDDHALLVGSVDFSHYLPPEVADFHDVLAQDVVRSLQAEEADRVEIDSPGALAVTLMVARDLDLDQPTIHAHTNSARLLSAEIEETTSHLIASFVAGSSREHEQTTMLFLGDMMFDRTVATRMKKANSMMYPFEKIRGLEDRFFHGQDVIVANLEGPVTAVRRPPVKSIDFAFDPLILPIIKKLGIEAVSQANNHSLDQGREGATESNRRIVEQGITVFGDQVVESASSSLAIIERRGTRIALLGFNITDNALDRKAAEQAMKTARLGAEHVVVFMHWGDEYHDHPNATQVELAHWFIDQGVDAVVGAHPHWMQSIEVYRGHPIAYSLGNFIFDQDWSPETQLGLVVGLSLSQQGSELHLFPINILASQPALLSGDQRRERLKHLADISDPALTEEIMSGVVRTEYQQ